MHSRFNIHLNVDVESTCGIKVNSQLVELLRITTLKIWDEAPMQDHHAPEAVDRTLQDILKMKSLLVD